VLLRLGRREGSRPHGNCRQPGGNPSRVDKESQRVGALTASAPARARREGRYRHRWAVLGAVFSAQLLNNMDRTAIALAAPMIIAEFGFSPSTWGWILSAFFMGYVPFVFIGGWAADKIGPRRVLASAVVVWSVFAAMTAAGFSFLSFVVFRVLFGSGEAPIAPVTAKTVNAWFPERKLSTAIGAATSANPLGGAMGTPIVIGLIAAFDSWRAPFIALGVVGLLFALGCWVTVRDHPSQHPWSSRAEIEEMAEQDRVVAARFETAGGTVQAGSVREHLFRPIVLLTAISWFGCVWLEFTFLNWFPLYLAQVHGVSLKSLAVANSVPWIAGTLGLLLGGVLVDALCRRFGATPFTPRKWSIVICILLAGAVLPFVGVVRSTTAAVLLMAVAIFLCFAPLGLFNSVVASVVPQSAFGGVLGFVLLIANLAGVISPVAVGYLLETSVGWTGVFGLAAAMAVAPILALAAFRSPTRAPGEPVATS
jgi:ACS family hexuronate transporter-like MFS transporter